MTTMINKSLKFPEKTRRTTYGGWTNRVAAPTPVATDWQVRTAWGSGHNAPASYFKERKQPYAVELSRRNQELETGRWRKQKVSYAKGANSNNARESAEFNYTPKTKLIFLKDVNVTQYGHKKAPRRQKLNGSDDVIHMTTDDSGSDVTASSCNSLISMSPADQLTISRYSSDAMSSSELCSYDSATGSRTSSCSVELDMLPPPCNTADALLTSCSSETMQADETSYNGSLRQSKMESDVDGGGRRSMSGTTSRTCSNELLNVISIDDDRLRYRHYNEMPITRSADATVMVIGRRNTEQHRRRALRPTMTGRERLIAALDRAMQPTAAATAKSRYTTRSPLLGHRHSGGAPPLPPVTDPPAELSRMVEDVWTAERRAVRRIRNEKQGNGIEYDVWTQLQQNHSNNIEHKQMSRSAPVTSY